MKKAILVSFAVILGTTMALQAEFQVNTYISDNQEHSAIAMDTAGNFVVVWESKGQDGNGDGVYGRRFDAAGTALGSEFQINTTIGGYQDDPDIAMDGEGNFVVVWEGPDVDGEGVYARLYSANGQPRTDEFPVNSFTADRQKEPRVAMNESGAFVIVWEWIESLPGNLAHWQVMGRLYDAAGVPQGTDFKISQLLNVDIPDVAMDESGDFVVAWRGRPVNPPMAFYVMCRMYNADGTPKGNAVQITGGNYTYFSSIATNSSGSFVITWSYHPDPSQRDVYAQRFDPDGNTITGPYMVNTYTTGGQGQSSAAMHDSGELVVVWFSEGQDGSSHGVFGQRYNSVSMPVDQEFQLNTYTLNEQWYPDIALSESGRFVVVWQSQGQDGSGYGIFAQFGQLPRQLTYYVDADAPGANDGSSWADAFTDLQNALIVAESGDEIRVSQGLYTPEDPQLLRRASNPNPADGAKSVSRTADLSWTAGSDATSHDVYFGTTRPGVFQGNQSGTIFDPGTMAYYTTYYWRIDELNNGSKTIGTVWTFTTLSSPPPPPPLADSNEQAAPAVVDRTATFQLINGVVIKGGYAGFGEPNADARDIEVYKTILSGDIGFSGNSSDNSFHVVTGTGTDETAVLDGFTITAGNANEDYPSPHANGGGMYNYSGSPTLINCTFIGNSAVRDGGGMFNGGQSNPTLTGCTFRGNSSIYEGGAISNRTSSPTITNCSFIENSSNHGGAISSWPGSPVVSYCTFMGNSAELGGAVFNYDSSPELTNCIFSNNYAEEVGGAICNLSSTVPLVQDNSGSLGGGTNAAKSIPLFADYVLGDNSSGYEDSVNTLSNSSTLTNCTFSGNSAMAAGGVCYIGESNPSLDNCTFSSNSAQIGGGFVISQGTAILTDCTFRGNLGEQGGAFYSEISSAVLVNCIFRANTSSYAGAAINEAISSSSLYNCLFNGNTSTLYGGAMYYWYESSPQMFNCTFAGNSALIGNAIVCAVPDGYYPPPPPSFVRAFNCIFWDGGNEIVNRDNSIITVTYSDVQGGYSGAGNITADPCFVQPDYFGPISYWKFDEADGTTAYDSAGFNHGNVHGAHWTAGMVDGALSFDGVDDYIDIEDDITLEPQNLTVSAWVYRESTFSQHVILQKGSTHSHDDRNGYLFKILDSSNSYPNSASLCVTINNGCNIYPISNTEIQAGIWYHIAATYDGSHAGIYVNGVEDGTDISDTGPVDYSGGYQNFKIGAQEEGHGLLLGHFDGIIDEVAIYERALSAEEIRQHYQNGLSGQGYPSMADYRLQPDSPCINAGDPYYIAESDETDLDGKPRVIAGRIDMGAYEFNHIPVADAGPDRTVEAQAPWGATVTLDGSGSSDADSALGTIDDINDFNWYQLDPCDPNADVLLGSGRIIDCNLPIGEHIILLEVIDMAGASDTDQVTIIVQDTTPPDINCPQDVTLEYPADTTPSATGKATATDTCGAVTITHSDLWQPSCGNAGTLARTWTATDESGNSSTCMQIITVVDTTPPVITCPPDVTLQCPADTSVEVNGSASAVDTCSSLAIAYSDLWQPGCGNTGTLARTWSATDDCGNSSSCVQMLTVVDTTTPDFELSVSPTMLWPPDHKMVLITPSWTVSDDCVPTADVSLVSIVANEGDNTIGDGHTSNDIQIGEDGSIYLRSERSGTGSDRIYTITYQAVDDCGNTTVRSASVSIPHDFKVLARIASRWLWAGSGRIPEDLNGDGFVNLKDIAIFANNWIQ